MFGIYLLTQRAAPQKQELPLKMGGNGEKGMELAGMASRTDIASSNSSAPLAKGADNHAAGYNMSPLVRPRAPSLDMAMGFGISISFSTPLPGAVPEDASRPGHAHHTQHASAGVFGNDTPKVLSDLKDMATKVGQAIPGKIAAIRGSFSKASEVDKCDGRLDPLTEAAEIDDSLLTLDTDDGDITSRAAGAPAAAAPQGSAAHGVSQPTTTTVSPALAPIAEAHSDYMPLSSPMGPVSQHIHHHLQPPPGGLHPHPHTVKQHTSPVVAPTLPPPLPPTLLHNEPSELSSISSTAPLVDGDTSPGVASVISTNTTTALLDAARLQGHSNS